MKTSLNFSPLPGIYVEKAHLKQYTTFQLGGACRALIDVKTPQHLRIVVQTLTAEKFPFLLIGGGSNLVVSDHGVDAFVVRYVADTPIMEINNDQVTVSGSTKLDQLAATLANQGWSGLNYTSGIPGTVGGAVVGNAGAFGKQVGDCLVSAVLLTKDGKENTVLKEAFDFAYRYSNLRKTGEIVSRVTFKLERENSKNLLAERTEILKIRSDKHPDLKHEPCAGSFFRNIEPASNAERRQAAGWFLEQAGAKNFVFGGAKIFSKHANIIIKTETGTAEDVYQLSEMMQACVKEKFALDLVREVRFVGKFKNAENNPQQFIW